MGESDSVLISKDAAMEYCGGDDEIFAAMVEMYAGDDRREELESNYAKADWPAYRISAHTVKTTSRTIGATALSDAAMNLEYAARDNDVTYINEHHKSFIEDYGKVLKAAEDMC